MKKATYAPRQHLFVCSSLLLFLALLLADCGATTSGGAATPTPGKMATLQTSCPQLGTARAAVMVPMALGKQNTVVYSQTLVLKRYTVSTGKTDVIVLGNGAIVGAHISADGQWVLMQTNLSGSAMQAMQLVRMDGQELQTLYCASGGGFGWMQWSPNNTYMAFIDTPGDQSTWTFKLLNVVTGALQTTGYNSKNLLYFPLEWLDNTHLYVNSFSPGTVPSNLYLLNVVTGEKQFLLKAPPHDFDASLSVDRTQLYTLKWTGSAGPSSMQVQPATGGPAKIVYSTSKYAINAMKVASSNTLLFLINNTNADTSHNGVWKIKTDGTGLTKLKSNSAILSVTGNEEIGFVTTFNWGMDASWANASRDGAYYSLEVFNRSGGSNRLLVSSMNGGAPGTIASSPDAYLIGWTTM